jgi:hypothetical protein
VQDAGDGFSKHMADALARSFRSAAVARAVSEKQGSRDLWCASRDRNQTSSPPSSNSDRGSGTEKSCSSLLEVRIGDDELWRVRQITGPVWEVPGPTKRDLASDRLGPLRRVCLLRTIVRAQRIRQQAVTGRRNWIHALIPKPPARVKHFETPGMRIY